LGENTGITKDGLKIFLESIGRGAVEIFGRGAFERDRKGESLQKSSEVFGG